MSRGRCGLSGWFGPTSRRRRHLWAMQVSIRTSNGSRPLRTEFLTPLDTPHRVVVLADELTLVRVEVEPALRAQMNQHTTPREKCRMIHARPDLLAQPTNVRDRLAPPCPCDVQHGASDRKFARVCWVAQVMQVDRLSGTSVWRESAAGTDGSRGPGGGRNSAKASAGACAKASLNLNRAFTHPVPASYQQQVGVGRMERER